MPGVGRNDPTQCSVPFTRSLTLTNVAPVNLYVVGVNYPAVNPNALAPTQAQVTNAQLPGWSRHIPLVTSTKSDMQPSTSSREVVTGNPNNGWTDGFNHLLDRICDMQGGSSDIYVAVLGPGAPT